MDCDLAGCPWYQPGLLNQDLYTLPLEAAAVTAITYGLSPPSQPRWPFENENAMGTRRPSRQPGYLGVGLGAAAMVPLIGQAWSENSSFPFWRHVRGYAHAHLLTEMITISAKTYFGRKRPFFDREAATGRDRIDDRMSFFSGHASHSATFATYASFLAHHYIRDPIARWTYTGLFSATAVWISASRAADGQHHWSDVVTGAAVGLSMGAFVAHRVLSLEESSVSLTLAPGSIGIGVRL